MTGDPMLTRFSRKDGFLELLATRAGVGLWEVIPHQATSRIRRRR